MYEHLSLNEWAASVVEDMLANGEVLGCHVHDVEGHRSSIAASKLRAVWRRGNFFPWLAWRIWAMSIVSSNGSRVNSFPRST